MSHEKRRARRVILNVPTVVQSIASSETAVHPSLEHVYQRVVPSAEAVGRQMAGVVRDVSINGAFIACEPLPLLTRVSFSFPLEGYGQVDALGWILWRREKECLVPSPDGESMSLPRGFGVLFEAIPLEARIAIHKLVKEAPEAL